MLPIAVEKGSKNLNSFFSIAYSTYPVGSFQFILSIILLFSLNFCFIPFSILFFNSKLVSSCILNIEFSDNCDIVNVCLFNSSASSDGPSLNSIGPFITSFIKSFQTKLNVPTHTLLLSIVDNLLVYVGVIVAFPVLALIILVAA